LQNACLHKEKVCDSERKNEGKNEIADDVYLARLIRNCLTDEYNNLHYNHKKVNEKSGDAKSQTNGNANWVHNLVFSLLDANRVPG